MGNKKKKSGLQLESIKSQYDQLQREMDEKEKRFTSQLSLKEKEIDAKEVASNALTIQNEQLLETISSLEKEQKENKTQYESTVQSFTKEVDSIKLQYDQLQKKMDEKENELEKKKSEYNDVLKVLEEQHNVYFVDLMGEDNDGNLSGEFNDTGEGDNEEQPRR